jgi:hypothetical protein
MIGEQAKLIYNFYMFHADLLLALFFNNKERGEVFFRNVG